MTTTTGEGAGQPDGSDRVQEFRAEIADMRLRDPRTAADRRLQVLGAVMMVVALGVVIGAFIYSSSGNPLEQRDAIVLALGGVALAVVGAALYLRASLAQFLRWWLARLTMEQQRQTDRIVGKSD